MNTIDIDTDACDGCRACVKACFVNVLRWDASSGKPVVAYAEDCACCSLCELSCPKDCIAVIPDFTYIRWSAWKRW